MSELVRRGVPAARVVSTDRDARSDASVFLFEDDDHELSLEGKAWEACCRNATGTSVRRVIDVTRADSAAGRAATLAEQTRCARDGDFGPHGAIAHGADGCPRGATCAIPQGTCSEFSSNLGCHGWIREDDAGTRKTAWICVD